MRWPLAPVALLVASVLNGACSRSAIVDTLMWTAHRPGERPEVEGYLLLAGDTHCHISPPDAPGHVSRGFDRTVELARDEGLDFVILTPHLWDRFPEDPLRRELARVGLSLLRLRASRLGDGDPVFVTGFEYTTRYGHVTAAFGDFEAALAEVPWQRAQAEPARFFEVYVASGGLLFVNHPYLTPVETVIRRSGWDLSWKHWTRASRVPSEIAAIERLAHGIEVYNLQVSHLHDRFLWGERDTSMRAALYRLTHEARAGRRLTPVGGTDSHGDHLRAATFVLARERTEGAIREALAAGRVCVRGPAACMLTVREPGGPWLPPGSSMGAGPVEVSARGQEIEILRDASVVATPRSREVVTVDVAAGRCTLLRARVDGSESGPVYIGCGIEGAGS